MRTYQIILRGGLTRNVVADGYRKGKKEIVFEVDDNPTERYERESVMRMDEIGPLEFMPEGTHG